MEGLSRAARSSLLERLATAPASFPGALLLHGVSEEALAETSLRLAAALLCNGDDPDHGCDSCRRVFRGLHPDLLMVEPEGVQIRVDRVREAIVFGAGRPYESQRRVVRIVRAELAGNEAANALLKSLEEPSSRVHWILASTRPESLLPTIRSRCTPVRVPSPSPGDRIRALHDAGVSEADAEDAVAFGAQSAVGEEARLDEGRQFRSTVVEALRSGISEGRLPALVLLAEALGRSEPWKLRVFEEVLADAALLAAGVSGELIRHRSVAGPLHEIARKAGSTALEKAVILAADSPPDNRRGNRRLHFERVLLELAGR
jgi:DNA polymerase-3 subunit delta'